MNTIEIDKKKCVQCGLCVKDCISECIQMDEENYPKMTHPARCLKCQHCLAICPKGALSFNGKNPKDSEAVNYDDLLTLIKSRRSIRHFNNDEIPEETFEKLKEMLHYVPTGCNSHALHFSIVEKREVMDVIRSKVNKNLIKAISNPVFSTVGKKFIHYKEALEKGEDIIFRGAPHIVVVSSPITAPCAPQDPIIALSYLELYAQHLGLGTCWCGYGEICVKIFPEISEILEIPRGYVPIYTMLLGIPDVKYARTIQPEQYMISEIRNYIPKDSCIFCRIKRFVTNFLR